MRLIGVLAAGICLGVVSVRAYDLRLDEALARAGTLCHMDSLS